jgi:hypothetical protein
MFNACLVDVPSFGTGPCFSPSFDGPLFLWIERWVFERAVYLESPIQRCGIPDSGDVTARSGS